MKTRRLLPLLAILLLLFSLSLTTALAQEEEMPKVRAILFYSPTCPHCEMVITTVLIPMIEEYGDQILVLGVDISTELGNKLFAETIEYIEFPMDQAGVPFMLVGDRVMIGSVQIPEELPILADAAMSADGIAWPEIPAVQEFLTAQGFVAADGADITPTLDPETAAEAPAAETPQPGSAAEATLTEVAAETAPAADSGPTPTAGLTLLEESGGGGLFEQFADRFNRDPLGNGISTVVLVFLIGVVVYIGVQFMRAAELKLWPEWILLALLVVGIVIAIYLSISEVSGDEVICGPVGDCNAVQQSKYATLFGFLPVAIFGLVGYIMIGISWWIGRTASGQTAFYAKLAMFLFALFGLLFFVYLTFLEPFVIGATCAWCVTSAILMAFINLFTLRIMLDAWAQLDIGAREEE